MNNTKTADAVRTRGLGKRYGSFWALEDCDVRVPAGSITALVGENGAGKSTLLQLLAGLNKPSAGIATVLENLPEQTPEFLASIGYLAQNIPLYPQFTATDYIAMGAHLNKTWDAGHMRRHMQELDIPLDKPVGKLSGGQRAQVALAMALAKRPQLLLLDEPVAALDPLARRDFLAALGKMVSEGGLTVVLSSHLLADLELLCDHLIILKTGHVQLCDSFDDVLQTYQLFVGPAEALKRNDSSYTVVSQTRTERQLSALLKINTVPLPPGIAQHLRAVTIEDVVLAYMQRSANPQTSNEQSQKGDA